MKNILSLIFLAVLVISCGTTQEVELEKPKTHESMPKPRAANKPAKTSASDIEGIVAQLGLPEDTEAEFLNMWYKTEDKMRKVRIQYKDDSDQLRNNMVAVKNERERGLNSILSPNQVTHFYEILAKNRKGNKLKRTNKNGN